MLSFLKKRQEPEEKVRELKAYISGKVIPIEEVADEVFSSKALGDGIGIEPTGDTVYAPCSGTVSVVMADSKHAVGMTLNNGAEILIHEGLDLLLKYAGGFTNEELADTFHEWNEGELQSYLIAITADIFREKDDLAPGNLIDHILDSAKQKGTGRWASIESLHQGVDISMITAACNARVMSNHLKQRQLAASRIYEPSHSCRKTNAVLFALSCN